MEPSDLHGLVERAFNEGDVEALMDLYEEEACMVREDGSVAEGLPAIREIWAGFVALGGQITMTTRYAVAFDDIALLSNIWKFAGAGMSFSAGTAEVARRQTDGSWLYVIDNPFGGAPPDA